jgi:hypothetical protein
MMGLSKLKGLVRDSLAIGGSEEERGDGGTEHGDGFGPVNDSPIASNEAVCGITEEELGVGGSLAV